MASCIGDVNTSHTCTCPLVFLSTDTCRVYLRFTVLSYFPLQIVHQLIERKQTEIRKVHPGLTCFNETGNRIDIKDIPGISKLPSYEHGTCTKFVDLVYISLSIISTRYVHRLLLCYSIKLLLLHICLLQWKQDGNLQSMIKG